MSYRLFEFPPIERLCYGRGSIARLSQAVEDRGARRVMLVTSPSVSRGLAGETVRRQLGDRLVREFAEVRPHVPAASVVEALRAAREAEIDLVVSVGGGSVIDTAKAVSMATRESVEDESDLQRLSVHAAQPKTPLWDAPLPHFAVPTTLGSSEFTYSFTVTNSATQTKDMYWEPRFAPVMAFLDADLAIHTPDWLWASTGIKTVDHCVEWYLSAGRTPFTDALVVDALQLLWRALPASLGDARDTDARQECQIAAWMSAYGALNVIGGLSHAIGHQLGARTRMVHGYTTSIVLPHALEFNRPASAPRQAALAQAIGVPIDGLTDEAAAAAFVERLRDLIARLELPSTLTEAGVNEVSLDGVAAATMEDPMLANNPRPVSPSDVEAILEACR